VSWRSVSRSVIGTLHQELQMPCQDYGGDRILDQVMLGAVADGAGSAKHADRGAQIVVETMLNYLVQSEAYLQRHQCSWQRTHRPVTEALMHKIFAKAVTKAQLALQQEANRQTWAMDDLAATLLAFVATPHWLAAMQIGDGFCVMRPQKSVSEAYQVLFQPIRGEYANQTAFVTMADALQHMQVRLVEQPPAFICAATDGLEKVAIRLQDWVAFPPFFRPLEAYLEETPDPDRDDRYLMDFLRSERLNQRTNDDKTLLLCRYCD
jgi:serine/threonine protein phosphatase PrpC